MNGERIDKKPAAGRRTWCSERFAALFEEEFDSASPAAGRKRVLDFYLLPGHVSARIQEENTRPLRAEIVIEQFTDEEWERIFEELSKISYFSAAMLAGELPADIEKVFDGLALSLVPKTLKDVRVACDCGARRCEHAPALIQKMLERLESDPFSIFLLRGRGHDETLSELRRRRIGMRSDALPEPAKPEGRMECSREEFYRAGQELHRLSYSIRADELPAALLRWLDPIPVGDADVVLERTLEEAYAQVARRAQAYGLGFAGTHKS